MYSVASVRNLAASSSEIGNFEIEVMYGTVNKLIQEIWLQQTQKNEKKVWANLSNLRVSRLFSLIRAKKRSIAECVR